MILALLNSIFGGKYQNAINPFRVKNEVYDVISPRIERLVLENISQREAIDIVCNIEPLYSI